MTLDAFADRLRNEPNREYEYAAGESGCGCMVDPIREILITKEARRG